MRASRAANEAASDLERVDMRRDLPQARGPVAACCRLPDAGSGPRAADNLGRPGGPDNPFAREPENFLKITSGAISSHFAGTSTGTSNGRCRLLYRGRL